MTKTSGSGADGKRIVDINLSEIRVADENVRKHGADQELDDLAESIKAVGLLQPVVLRGPSGRGKYDLIVGQRRFLAHKKLGRKTIRAVVHKSMSRDDAMIRSLVENMLRVELNHADAAKATTALFKRLGRDVKAVSKATGLSTRRVRQYVKIEELASDETKRKLRDNEVEPADVQRALEAAKGNIDKADDLLEMMQEYKLDNHQKARLREIGESRPSASARTIFEEALRPQVRTSVVVPLPERLRDGLETAAKQLRATWEQVAARALEYWLQRNGYLGR